MKTTYAGITERIEIPVAGLVTATSAPTLYVNGSSSAVTVTVDSSTAYKLVITHTTAGRSVGDILDYRGGTATVNGTAYPIVIDPRYVDATVASRVATGGNVNVSSMTDGVMTAAKFGSEAPNNWIRLNTIADGTLVYSKFGNDVFPAEFRNSIWVNGQTVAKRFGDDALIGLNAVGQQVYDGNGVPLGVVPATAESLDEFYQNMLADLPPEVSLRLNDDGVRLKTNVLVDGGASLALAGAGVNVTQIGGSAIPVGLLADMLATSSDTGYIKVDVVTINGEDAGPILGGGQAGGFTQSITVTSAGSGAAIESAVIRYAQAGVTRDEGTTDADGLATVAVLAGTFTRTVYSPGFDAKSETVIVTGDADDEVELTPLGTEGTPANVAPGLAN